MKKYFIEYPENNIYTCFDGEDGFVNLRFKHNDKEYLFAEFVFNNHDLIVFFKKVIKLTDKSNDLNSVLAMIIDQFNEDLKKVNHGEFRYFVLPEKNRNLKFEKGSYPCIHIFTNNQYYDYTYSGKMMYDRIKKKLSVIYFNF